MKALSMLAGAALALGFFGSAANAAPLPGPSTAPQSTSLVEQTQGWRYHRSCVWVNGGWHYGQPGKYLVCRPHRPAGRGWVWYSEGGRHGWYHPHRKHWHHNKW